MPNFAFKFQAVAEKTAKDIRGHFILPHPVDTIINFLRQGSILRLLYCLICLSSVRLGLFITAHCLVTKAWTYTGKVRVFCTQDTFVCQLLEAARHSTCTAVSPSFQSVTGCMGFLLSYYKPCFCLTCV